MNDTADNPELTVRDLFIGTQNLTVLDILGIDPDMPIEILRRRLRLGERATEPTAKDDRA